MKHFKKADDPALQGRVPPGQYLTEKWPVLHYGPVPTFNARTWDFRVFGEVEHEVRLGWEQFQALDRECAATFVADMHCVTSWSRLDQRWEGIPFSKLVEMAKPTAKAKFVISHGEYGFTANVPIEDAQRDSLIALRANGETLTQEHGYPCRLVIPHLYAWKGAKWCRGIEFRADDAPGFWERNGYHNHGDPWKEERYWGD
ncbi:MAG: sulfite oxidase-like oxidoreductase [Chloroflexi bacterium]|nr:sulfite oxidase-like oxidoreductase [Chloroflexota bacterium]